MSQLLRFVGPKPNTLVFFARAMSGKPGDGAGKGGAADGSIRDAGGAFGRREAALEDQYFYKLQGEQLSKIKDDIDNEISYHEEQIKHHQEAIARNKQRVAELTDVKK